MASPWLTTIAPIGLIPPPPDGRFDEDYNYDASIIMIAVTMMTGQPVSETSRVQEAPTAISTAT